VDVLEWLAVGGMGIGHRESALRSGVGPRSIRAALSAGVLVSIRRSWLATPTATGDMVDAARLGARVACLSAARARGWWLPEHLEPVSLHLHFHPHARSAAFAGVAHWTTSIAPTPRTSLIESPEDALAHIAGCLDPESARVVWESAVRVENLSLEALRNVRWTSRAAKALAQEVNGLSDSGLESILLVRLSPWGLPLHQQVKLAGRFVDLLIGERLVVQVDGYAFHSSSAQRARDVAHDAELRLRGYTVLRFTYAQVVHDWPAVERTIARAIAIGAHRAA
jgi:very-short-patch-repair endonuclease